MGERVGHLPQNLAIYIERGVAGLVIAWIEGLSGASAEPVYPQG